MTGKSGLLRYATWQARTGSGSLPAIINGNQQPKRKIFEPPLEFRFSPAVVTNHTLNRLA
jgi:hypothetical protein